MAESNLRWWVLTTVIIGTFLGRLDQTIVNLALPKIITAFRITVVSAGWIATAYIIANAVFVPVWGKLGDKVGRKKIYILGFSIFILGSVLAGLAWNLTSLIFFRVIQATASAADYPTAMAIITITFKQGKERAQALGLWSTSFAAATVFGPLIGGPLIDFFGWRSVFLVNLPVGIIGMFMAIKFIDESVSNDRKEKFDIWGTIYLGVTLSSLVLVLDQGMTWGWLSLNSIICYVVIVVFFILFYLTEKHHTDPIVDLKFFKNKIFVGTLVNNFVVFMGMMGSVFLIPLFSQTFLGYSAQQSGYLFIPMAAFMVISAQIGGRLIGKIKSNYVMALSTFIAAIGLMMFGLYIDPRSNAWAIVIPLSVMAFGLGLGMAQRTSAIANAVPQNEIGIASSILALTRNISGAFGIAIFATILDNRITSNIIRTAQHTVINSINPTVYQKVAGLIILKSEVSAYSYVFWISALVVFIGAIMALFIKITKETNVKVHIDA